MQVGDDFDVMLKKFGMGLLLIELMGQGVNYVMGDYLCGVVGFWVENGVIQYLVEEIIVVSMLQEMFCYIVVIGVDLIVCGMKEIGLVLIEQMMIVGQ